MAMVEGEVNIFLKDTKRQLRWRTSESKYTQAANLEHFMNLSNPCAVGSLFSEASLSRLTRMEGRQLIRACHVITSRYI